MGYCVIGLQPLSSMLSTVQAETFGSRDTFLCESPVDVEQMMYTHGAAVIPGDLSHDCLQTLVQSAMSMKSEWQPRSPGGRWSCNNYKLAEDAAYNKLVNSLLLANIIDLITRLGSRRAGGIVPPHPKSWTVGNVGGDIVEPHTMNYQPLHSDWPGLSTSEMSLGFALAVSVAPYDIDCTFAPIRIISWSEMRSCPYSDLSSEADKTNRWLGLCRGDFLIRDVRAAHGGTPNHTGDVRVLPGVQIVSPEYRTWNCVTALQKRLNLI